MSQNALGRGFLSHHAIGQGMSAAQRGMSAQIGLFAQEGVCSEGVCSGVSASGGVGGVWPWGVPLWTVGKTPPPHPEADTLPR